MSSNSFRNVRRRALGVAIRRQVARPVPGGPMLQTLEPRRLFAAVSWDGGAGTLEWNDPGNWSDDQLPTLSDDVTINITGSPTVSLSGVEQARTLTTGKTLSILGSLEVAQASTVTANVALTGTILGAGTLTINGNLSWTAGAMTDGGTTIVNGTSTLTPPSGNEIYLIGSRHLTLNGASTLNGSAGGLNVRDAAVLTVPSGAALTLHGNAHVDNGGGSPSIVNHGTIKTDFVNTTSAIGIPIVNDGTLAVSAGSLNLTGGTPAGGGNALAGTTTIASGSTLGFAGGTFAAGAFSSSGAGTLSLDAAEIDFNATSTIASAFAETSGNLAGTGTVTVSGASNWTGGAMTGSGTTRFMSNATLMPPQDNELYVLDARRLTFAGNATLNGSVGGVNVRDAATLEVASSGTLTFHGDAHVDNGGSSPSLIVDGTITTDFLNSVSAIGIPIRGSGLFVLGPGTLKLAGGTVNSTNYDPANPSGDLHVGITIGNGGRLEFSGGTFDVRASNESGIGTLAITGGDVRFQGANTVAGPTSFESGSLEGQGTVDFSGAFAWTGGAMADSGTTKLSGASTFTPPPDNALYLLTQRHLTLAGNATLNGSIGGLNVRDAVVIEVATAGSLTFHGDAHIDNGGSSPSLVNRGTLKSDVDGSVAMIGIPIGGPGSFDLAAGTLKLGGGTYPAAAGVSPLSGSATLADGAALDFAGGTFDVGTFTDSGDGKLQVDGAAANFNAVTTLQAELDILSGTLAGSGRIEVVNSGGLQWHGGAMAGTGTTVADDYADLTPSVGYTYLTEARHLTLNSSSFGQSFLGAAPYSLFIRDAATLEIGATGTLDLDQSINSGGGSPQLLNNGTLNLSSPTSDDDPTLITIALGVRVNNHGVVNVSDATLNLVDCNAGEGAYLSGGTYYANFNGVINFPGDLDTLTAHIQLFSTGTINGLGHLNTNRGEIELVGHDLTIEPFSGVFSQEGIVDLYSSRLNITGNAVFAGPNQPLFHVTTADHPVYSQFHVTGTLACSSAGTTSRFDPDIFLDEDPPVGQVDDLVHADGGITRGFDRFFGDQTPSGNSMRYLYSPGGSDIFVKIVANGLPAAPKVLSMTYDYVTRQAITIQFDSDVGPFLNPEDLRVSDGIGEDSYFYGASISYDAATHRATVTFPQVLPDGNYHVTVNADDVANSAGVPLQTASSVDFFVLAGDANHDRKVDFNDLVALAQNYNQSGRTFAQGNYNYSADGVVDFADLVILAQQYNKTLAAITQLTLPSALGALPVNGKGRVATNVLS